MAQRARVHALRSLGQIIVQSIPTDTKVRALHVQLIGA